MSEDLDLSKKKTILRRLGDIYRDGGPGLPHDLKEAADWYRRSGNKSGLLSIAVLCYEGPNELRDYVMAR